jgi:hypothetical protein
MSYLHVFKSNLRTPDGVQRSQEKPRRNPTPTAQTAQEAAPDGGLAPLMGWVEHREKSLVIPAKAGSSRPPHVRLNPRYRPAPGWR